MAIRTPQKSCAFKHDRTSRRQKILPFLLLLVGSLSPLSATQFHQAAQAGDVDAVRSLLKHHNAGERDQAGNTALHLAALHGKFDVCEVLLEHGADVRTRDRQNNYALDLAYRNKHTHIVELLRKGLKKALNQTKTTQAQKELESQQAVVAHNLHYLKLLQVHYLKLLQELRTPTPYIPNPSSSQTTKLPVDITDEAFRQQLAGQSHLEKLDLTGCLHISEASLEKVIQALPRLTLHPNIRTLNLQGCRYLTAGPKHSTPLQGLEVLDIRGCARLAKDLKLKELQSDRPVPSSSATPTARPEEKPRQMTGETQASLPPATSKVATPSFLLATSTSSSSSSSQSVLVAAPLVKSPPIPAIAQGYEDIYRRFLKGVLIYRPTEGSEVGRVNLPIMDLGNPLEGTFDLSACGDTGKHLSINTGYRKGKSPENAGKVEIWFTPRFLVEKELKTSAKHFKDIFLKEWPESAPVGIIWTWGGWDKMEWYDYLTNQNMEQLGKDNLYKKWGVAEMSDTGALAVPGTGTALWRSGRRASCYVFELK